MDIVITYVNGNDPVWRREYEQYTHVPLLEKRFRDWGTLKYLLRGIEKNMPFIRNVFLVVSGDSQVPDWADREQLKIVRHADYIPAGLLPVFSANPIELHLHNIEGLDEEYLYFNDDIFPVAPCRPEDFFRGGRPVLGFKRQWLRGGMFGQICVNSYQMACSALGTKPGLSYLRPQHICTTMLKSRCAELYDRMSGEILEYGCTRVREACNVNQYAYLDYMYMQGLTIRERLSAKHFSLAVTSAAKLRDFLKNPTRKLVCINDVKLSEKRSEEFSKAMSESFEELFPHKSRFEI